MRILIVNVNQYIGAGIVIHKVSEFGWLTKPGQIRDRIGLWTGLDSGLDRTLVRIGLRIRWETTSDRTPDWIGLESLLLGQNYYFV